MNNIKTSDYYLQLDETAHVLKKARLLTAKPFRPDPSITTIGRYGFSNQSYLKEIVIPATVETIEDAAFSNCSQLTSVIFEPRNTPLTLGGSVFIKCAALQKIELPEGVTVLKDKLFEDCVALEEVRIPASVEEIKSHVFKHTPHLKRIHVDEANPHFGSYQGILFSTSSLLRVPSAFPCNQEDGRMVLPLQFVLNSVRLIEQEAFEGSCIRYVTIPSNVHFIDFYAFQDCKQLESANLRNSKIPCLRMGTFKGCSNLTDVSFPPTMNIVGPNVFEDCEELRYIDFPIQVWRIKPEAFKNCKHIEKIYFSGRATNGYQTPKIDSTFHLPEEAHIVYGVSREGWERFQPELKNKIVIEITPDCHLPQFSDQLKAY